MSHASRICEAMRRRCLIRLWYKDHQTSTTVEPYTYGENRAGNTVLSAWLVAGETHTPGPPFWRLYRESDIRQLEILDQRFPKNRVGYKPGDPRFKFIRCSAAAPEPENDERII